MKYEEVYLHAYANGTEARAALSRYFRLYNAVRTHQSLEYRTPDEVYFGEPAVDTDRGVADDDRERLHHGDFRGYRGSGCLEISAPAASYAFTFSHNASKPGASAGCAGRLPYV